MSNRAVWPVLTRYSGEKLNKIALPIGGIGTGTVSLGGRGDLRDWEIVNRPAKGFTPNFCFFALWTKPEGKPPVTRALEGSLPLSAYEGGFGATVRNHGLPRFRECTFEAAYPLGRILLSDPTVPLTVSLEAFNPLIPGDSERSGIPVAVLRYVLTNPGDTPVEASVCGNVQNFIGEDGTSGKPQGNTNVFRNGETGKVSGLFLRPGASLFPSDERWGSIALTVLKTENSIVTHRTSWAKLSWGDSLLDFWDDFSEDGDLEDKDVDGEDAPVASLASRFVVPAQGTATVTFLLTWHFPNRQIWFPAKTEIASDLPSSSCGCEDGSCNPDASPDWIGNYYTTKYRDAYDVAVKTAAVLSVLEDDTVKFVRAFCESDLPTVVKEAALYNLSTLRTQTSFRTPDGHFFGWEGCGDKSGCCEGTCTHVWNYETASALLFGDLARSMRTIEFAHTTAPNGHMSFRVFLPLSRAQEFGLSAADGQMGCLMKLYRDWKLSGDTDFLQSLWPHARRALEFCWIEGGWDADRDGVMEGCQHNTMDVEYYGPNPQMGVWYLGALRACEEMARSLGEMDFAEECRRLFTSGSAWIDANLFNGDYYEHHILPPKDTMHIAPGLRHESMGARNLEEPELQLGAGCLIDQLVGQYMAHVCGLGFLLKPENIRKTLESLMRYNFKSDLSEHFNHMRTFALGDEAALLMASYPKGRRPKRPFPYYNEVMTGFEHTAAAHMIYEGLTEEALTVISAIRARYDGQKRSPFDEAECGHHYARAMASWTHVLALTGFHFDGILQTMTFAPAPEGKPVRWFWSNGSAWGVCEQRPAEDAIDLRLSVLFGEVSLKQIVLTGYAPVTFAPPVKITQGNPQEVVFRNTFLSLKN